MASPRPPQTWSLQTGCGTSILRARGGFRGQAGPELLKGDHSASYRNNTGTLMGLPSAERRVRLAAMFPQTDQWPGGDGKQNDSLEPRRSGKPRNQWQETADGPEDEGEAGQADQSSGREGFPHLFHCSDRRGETENRDKKTVMSRLARAAAVGLSHRSVWGGQSCPQPPFRWKCESYWVVARRVVLMMGCSLMLSGIREPDGKLSQVGSAGLGPGL